MIRRPLHPRDRRRGFTLIESMATVSVLAILGSIASFVILDAVNGYSDASNAAQLHAEMSIAMDRISRDLRRIELDSTAGVVAPDVNNVTNVWIQWDDTAGDSYQVLYDSGTDTVKLEYDGGGLGVLLTDVTACTISTYDEDDVQLAWIIGGPVCDDIRRVQVEVTCERGGVTEYMRTKVYVRSTMTGAMGGA